MSYSSRKSILKSIKNSSSNDSQRLTWQSKKQLTPQEIVFNRMPGWIGDHLIRLECHDKGLRYYKEALEKNPRDSHLLFKRANAYGKCFEMQKGLADVDRIAKIDPTNVQGIIRRMRFLYLNGEFEKCLMLSFNHLQIRRQPPHFALGCLTAKNAVEDCLGKRAGHPLRNYYEIIRDKAWQDNAAKERGQQQQRRRKRKKKSRESETEPNVMVPVKPFKPVKPLNIFLEEEEEEEDEEEVEVELKDLYRKSSVRSSISKKDYRKKKKTIFIDKISKVRNIPRVDNMKIKDKRISVDSRGESTASLSNLSLGSSITGSLNVKFSPVHVPQLYAYPYHPLQKRTNNIDNYIACTYLRQLFNEKQFLTNISKSPGYNSKNENGNQIIVASTKDGLDVLDDIQTILRTRKPFYNIKYQASLNHSKSVEMDKLKLMDIKKTNAINKLNCYFATIAKYIRKLDVRKMNKTADNMYRYCKNTSRTILPNRNMILCRLYKLLGDGTLFSYRFLPGMTQTQMMIRVKLALALPVERRISQESFLKRFKGRGLNWLDLISTFEQRVRNCKYSEEIIWLYHELSKFNLELKRYTLAKTYCGRCIHESRKCEDFKWAVNGYMLMTRIAVFQKNKNDVRRNLRLAISTAKNIDIKELDAFLQSCLGVINEWKFEKAKVEEVFHRRQERIIELLQPFEKKKRQAMLLFDMINVRPPDRRLPIIPGLVDTDDYDVIERTKEEKKKKRTVSQLRGKEAEHMIYGYLDRPNEV